MGTIANTGILLKTDVVSNNVVSNDVVLNVQDWLNSLCRMTLDFLPKLLVAIIILLIGWWLTKKVNKLIIKALNRADVEPTAITFISQVTLFTLRILVIISVVAQLGFNVTTIITALCGASLTLGLALKDSLANLASGIIIIINKPFKKDDYIEFEGLMGTVKKIEISNTFLTTVDNKEVIIPNSRLTLNNVVNYTSLEDRRLDLCYQVSYDCDILKAKRLLVELVDSQEKFKKDPKPIIGISGHNDSSVAIDVKAWCSKEDYWDLYYEMQEKVKLTFDAEGIEIPFNQVVVHMQK